MGDQTSVPGSGRSSGEGKGYPLQYSCLENPMDREAWQVTVHGVTKSWTQLSGSGFPDASVVKNPSASQDMQVWSLGQEDPLGEEIATPSSSLAGKIPWTEEPDGLQSLGSQKVRHDSATKHAFMLCKDTVRTSFFISWLQTPACVIRSKLTNDALLLFSWALSWVTLEYFRNKITCRSLFLYGYIYLGSLPRSEF